LPAVHLREPSEQRKDGQVPEHVLPVAHQAARRIEHPEVAESTDGMREIADGRGIGGGAAKKFRLQPIDIGIDGKVVAGVGFNPDKFFRIEEGEHVDFENLFPLRTQFPMGVGTDEPMQAGLESVGSAVPAHGKAAAHLVHFEHFHVIAAFQSVDGSREPGDAAADDDDLSAILFHFHLPGHTIPRAGSGLRQIDLSTPGKFRQEL
jgi:hypothetical protein